MGTSSWADVVTAGTVTVIVSVTVSCIAETALACVKEQCGVGALFTAWVRGIDAVWVDVENVVVGATHGRIRETGAAGIDILDSG